MESVNNWYSACDSLLAFINMEYQRPETVEFIDWMTLLEIHTVESPERMSTASIHVVAMG